MSQRFDAKKVAPKAMKAMLELEKYVRSTSLEKNLLELVKMRASQLNGCAYCLDMHSKDALAAGEDPRRLFCLPAWREAPIYSEREKAALEFTEKVTFIFEEGVPDFSYRKLSEHFTEEEIVDLIMAINAINSWNRLNVTARTQIAK